MHKVIREVISKELAKFCYDYFCTKRKVVKLFHNINYISSLDENWGVWSDDQIPNTYSHYSDIVMETLLTKLHPLMEIETETELHPTYSYARLYKKGDILERHKDRPSCKISTTLNLGGDSWPIFLESSGKEGEEGTSVLLESGDMLIYDGVKLEHWREEFKGEQCGQVFLHYNNASLDTGENNKYDGRPFLGLPPWFRGFKLNDNYDSS